MPSIRFLRYRRCLQYEQCLCKFSAEDMAATPMRSRRISLRDRLPAGHRYFQAMCTLWKLSISITHLSENCFEITLVNFDDEDGLERGPSSHELIRFCDAFNGQYSRCSNDAAGSDLVYSDSSPFFKSGAWEVMHWHGDRLGNTAMPRIVDHIVFWVCSAASKYNRLPSQTK